MPSAELQKKQLERTSSSCQGCGAEIYWAIDAVSGATVPVEKRRTATYEVTHLNRDNLPVVVKSTRYISHFVTCPDRARFSRRNT